MYPQTELTPAVERSRAAGSGQPVCQNNTWAYSDWVGTPTGRGDFFSELLWAIRALPTCPGNWGTPAFFLLSSRMPPVCTLGVHRGPGSKGWLMLFWRCFGGNLTLFVLTARTKADLLEQVGVPCFASHGLPLFLFAVSLEREAPLDPCTPRRGSSPILPSFSSSCPACYLPDEAK